MDSLANTKKEINGLDISDEFRKVAECNHLHTLGDFLSLKVKQIMEMPGMNYRMLAELNSILKSHGLLERLEEI